MTGLRRRGAAEFALAALMSCATYSFACGPEIADADNPSPYMKGVPVPKERQVSDDITWARDYQRVLWANQNIQKILTVDPISRGSEAVAEIPWGDCAIMTMEFEASNGERQPLTQILSTMETDGFIVIKNGALRAELYFNGFSPEKRHQTNSVSKSFLGLLAGVAVAEGKLAPNQALVKAFPELAGSGVADGTLQHALDMALAVETPMSWADPKSYRHLNFMAGGFYRRFEDFPYRNTLELIKTVEKNGDHGELFFYSPANTELIGWSLSRAYQKNWQEVLSEKIWSKLGAERDAFVIVDPAGHGFATAGIGATLRDLARLGLMVENNGYFNEQQIVPRSWIQQTIQGNSEVRAAMQNQEELTRFEFPVFYHNQFRVLNSAEGELAAMGGIGQVIYVNQKHDLVAVFLATTFDSPDRSHQIHLVRQIRDYLSDQSK